jgi:hypothetical protein
MPQDIKTGSVYNTQVPTVIDAADIIAALTNYHYGVTDGVAPADNTIVSGANGIAGLFKSKANLAGPTFTGTVVLPSTTSIGNVSNTELGYLDGVTSSIQTQIGLKANAASPTFTGTVTLNSVIQGPTSSITPLFIQPAPTNKAGNATLTIAEILKGIITVSGTGNKTLTLPTGTLSDAGILSGAAPVRTAFDWSIVNNSGAGIDVAAGADHTLVPSSISLQDGSGSFRTVKTATNTFITYWLGR